MILLLIAELQGDYSQGDMFVVLPIKLSHSSQYQHLQVAGRK